MCRFFAPLLSTVFLFFFCRGFGAYLTRHDPPCTFRAPLPLPAQIRGSADTVYNMLEDSQGSKFTEAGLHLRKAAGLFQRLNTVMTTMRRRA